MNKHEPISSAVLALVIFELLGEKHKISDNLAGTLTVDLCEDQEDHGGAHTTIKINGKTHYGNYWYPDPLSHPMLHSYLAIDDALLYKGSGREKWTAGQLAANLRRRLSCHKVKVHLIPGEIQDKIYISRRGRNGFNLFLTPNSDGEWDYDPAYQKRAWAISTLMEFFHTNRYPTKR